MSSEGPLPRGSPQEDNATARTKAIRDAEAMMKELKIARPAAVMAEVTAPGTFSARPLAVETNVFGLRIENPDMPIFRYDIDVWGDFRDKKVELSKRGREDHVVIERKKWCLEIFKLGVSKLGCYKDSITFFYDGQSILYTLDELKFKSGKDWEEVIVNASESKSLESLERFSGLHINFKKCDVGWQTSLADIKRVDGDLEKKDRSALQFIDVVTNMSALCDRHDRFTVFQNGKIFPNFPDKETPKIITKDLGEGKYLNAGANKGIRLIEGPRGRGNASPAVIVDSLRAAFHTKMKVIEKAALILKRDKIDKRLAANEIMNISQQIRNLGCTTKHTQKPRTVEIAGVSLETAATKTLEFVLNGEKKVMSVRDYFQSRYNLTLQYPDAPLIMCKERGQMNLYPMEVLEIKENQRVTIPQTTSDQSKATTKMCAVPPLERQAAIWQQVNLLDLLESPYLKTAGISVVAKPLQIQTRQLPPPQLIYGGNATVTCDPNLGKWQSSRNKFIAPATCDSWAIYGLPTGRDRFGIDELREFGKMYLEMMTNKGIRIGLPGECQILTPQGKANVETVVRDKLKIAAQFNCKFVFFIMSESFTFHKMVKLEERTAQIVTQNLKMRTALNVVQKKQMMTVENIVNKTNLKLGGLNYGVSLVNVVKNYDAFPAHRLFIGIGISHPPPSSCAVESLHKVAPPSIVGFAANMGNISTEISGDFVYQEARREELIHSITEIIQTIVQRYRGGGGPDGGDFSRAPPKEVIIYRQGLSEGSYPLIICNEVPLIRHALSTVGAGDAKIIYITAQKEHNVRIMLTKINASDRCPQQNIGVGTVVDSCLTHPNYKEFYLNSHATLQGSARTPRYTVLVDDMNKSLDELEMLTQAQAFNFQIVGSPVSLPAPLYIANRYAERGRDLFVAKMTDEHGSTDSTSTLDLDKLNKKLTYKHTSFLGQRINA